MDKRTYIGVRDDDLQEELRAISERNGLNDANKIIATNSLGFLDASFFQAIVKVFDFANITDYSFDHNFGRIANVMIIDETGYEIEPEIQNTVNSTRIISNSPISGKIICT